MYKTCFEYPHIREYHAGMPGRISWHCPKLMKILGKRFAICNMGTRPKICPLLKKKGVNKVEIKENECKIYYCVKEKILPFEKQLIKLFKDNGFRCWASGYGYGVRDLCFKKGKK